jgi:hypothetical protein
MTETTKYYKYNLVTLPCVNLLFDYMLLNSLIHINLSPITKRHGELTTKKNLMN